MRRALCTAALLLAACGQAPLPAEIQGQQEAIVNGTVDRADPQVACLVVQRPDGGGYLCSGALLGPQTFLTAGHCSLEVGGDNLAQVYFVPNLLVSAPPSQVVVVDAAVTHPGYNPRHVSNQNDVGLLHLSRPMPGPFATPNRIPLERLPLLGSKVRFVGYGITGGGKEDDGVKRQVTKTDVSVQDNTEIDEGPAGGLTCSGDSGGPSFLTLPDGREALIGVTSRGDENCKQNGIDTRVDPYLASFLEPFLAAHGDLPSCDSDGRCGFGCTTPDPDCPCAQDGLCTAACPDPSTDPDCPQSCLYDGGSCLPVAPLAAVAAPPQSSGGCQSSGGAAGLALLVLLWAARGRRPS